MAIRTVAVLGRGLMGPVSRRSARVVLAGHLGRQVGARVLLV